MKKILGMIILTVLLTSNISAEESEAKKLCDAEIKKEQPQINVLQKQCMRIALEYEKNKKFERASWYYLMGMQYEHNINSFKDKNIKDQLYLVNIAHSNMLFGNINKSIELYKKYSKNKSMSFVLDMVSREYIILEKIYPQKINNIKEALDILQDYERFRMGSKRTKYSYGAGFPEALNAYKKGKKYSKLNDYPHALEYFNKALEITEAMYGGWHNYTKVLYRKNIQYCINNKDYKKAYKFANKLFLKLLKEIENDFISFDRKRKNEYMSYNNKSVVLFLRSSYLYICSTSQISLIPQQILNSWLAYKGSIFDSENAIAIR